MAAGAVESEFAMYLLYWSDVPSSHMLGNLKLEVRCRPSSSAALSQKIFILNEFKRYFPHFQNRTPCSHTLRVYTGCQVQHHHRHKKRGEASTFPAPIARTSAEEVLIQNIRVPIIMNYGSYPTPNMTGISSKITTHRPGGSAMR